MTLLFLNTINYFYLWTNKDLIFVILYSTLYFLIPYFIVKNVALIGGLILYALFQSSNLFPLIVSIVLLSIDILSPWFVKLIERLISLLKEIGKEKEVSEEPSMPSPSPAKEPVNNPSLPLINRSFEPSTPTVRKPFPLKETIKTPFENDIPKPAPITLLPIKDKPDIKPFNTPLQNKELVLNREITKDNKLPPMFNEDTKKEIDNIPPSKEKPKENNVFHSLAKELENILNSNSKDQYKEEFVESILSDPTLLQFFKEEYSIDNEEKLRKKLLSSFLDDPKEYISIVGKDPKNFYTHHLILGGTGSGKTYMTKYLLFHFYNIIKHIIVFDIKDAEFSQILLPLKHYNLSKEAKKWLKQQLGEKNFNHWYEKGLPGIKIQNQPLHVNVIFNDRTSNSFYKKVLSVLKKVLKNNPYFQVKTFKPNTLDIAVIEQQTKLGNIPLFLKGLDSNLNIELFNFFDYLFSIKVSDALEQSFENIFNIKRKKTSLKLYPLVITLYILHFILNNFSKVLEGEDAAFFKVLGNILFNKKVFSKKDPLMVKLKESIKNTPKKDLYVKIIDEILTEINKILMPYSSEIRETLVEKLDTLFEIVETYKDDFLNDVVITYDKPLTLNIVLTDLDTLSSSIPVTIHKTTPKTLIIIDELFNAFVKSSSQTENSERELIGTYLIKFLNVARSSMKTLYAISQGFEIASNYVININNLIQSFLNWYIFNPKTKNLILGGVDLNIIGRLSSIQTAIREKYHITVWYYRTKSGRFFVTSKKHYIPHFPLEYYDNIVTNLLLEEK